MKLSSLLYGLLPLAALAASGEKETPKGGASADAGKPTQPLQLSNVKVDVVFPNAQGADIELMNGAETPVEFVVHNKEKTPITIAGMGGAFLEKKPNKKGEAQVYANLTTTTFGESTEVKSGGSVKIAHRLTSHLAPYDFDLALLLFGSVEDTPAVVQLDKVPVTITEEPISWFDPRLILAQLIMAGALLAGGYFVTTTFVFPYLDTGSSSKKSSKKPATKSTAQASGVNPNSEGYDESWIPENHLKQTKQSRKKKN